jgi:hypothetical protein
MIVIAIFFGWVIGFITRGSKIYKRVVDYFKPQKSAIEIYAFEEDSIPPQKQNWLSILTSLFAKEDISTYGHFIKAKECEGFTTKVNSTQLLICGIRKQMQKLGRPVFLSCHQFRWEDIPRVVDVV